MMMMMMMVSSGKLSQWVNCHRVDLGPLEFLHSYLLPGKPVVVENAFSAAGIEWMRALSARLASGTSGVTPHPEGYWLRADQSVSNRSDGWAQPCFLLLKGATPPGKPPVFRYQSTSPGSRGGRGAISDADRGGKDDEGGAANEAMMSTNCQPSWTSQLHGPAPPTALKRPPP